MDLPGATYQCPGPNHTPRTQACMRIAVGEAASLCMQVQCCPQHVQQHGRVLATIEAERQGSASARADRQIEEHVHCVQGRRHQGVGG